jgi:hypothetical protein
MTLLRHFPALSYAFALVSILAACLAQDAIIMLLFAGGAAVASRLFADGPRAKHLTRGRSLFLTMIIIIGIGTWIFSNPTPEDAMRGIAIFAVWMLVIKLYERRTLEIEAERLILSVLLMVLATMDAFDLLFGALFMVWAVLGTIVIMLFHLHHGAEFSGLAVADVGARDDPTIGAHVRRHFRNAVLTLVATVVLATSAIFLLFPRGVSPQLATAAAARISRTGGGLNSDVTLLSGTHLVETSGTVGTVSIEMLQEGATPPQRLYLRTATSSVYMGNGRWQPTPYDLPIQETVAGGIWTPLDFSDAKPTRQLRIDLSEELKYLPIPGGSVSMRSSEVMKISIFPDRGVIALAGGPIGVVQIRDSAGPPTAGGAARAPGIVPAAAIEVARQVMLAYGLPFQSPSNLKEAVDWRVSASQALEAYLQSSRFLYTLDLSRIGRNADVRDMDPIERFLLAEPVGHCEYYAAAFVSMCQSLGLEARIVAGFLVQQQEPGGHQYIIMDRDAHAWAEVRVDEFRWARFDPTVARRVEAGGAKEGLLASLTSLYYGIEVWWRLNILGFDVERQNELAEDVLPPAMGVVSQVQAWFEARIRKLDVAFGFGRMGTIYTMAAIVLLGSTGILLWRSWVRRRRFRRRLGLRNRADVSRSAPAVAAYRDLLALLKKAGFVKPDHMAPFTWCQSIAQSRPDLVGPALRVVKTFYAIRYGGQVVDAKCEQETRADLATIRSVLEKR